MKFSPSQKDGKYIEPLISVIVPAYNKELSIQRCLNSILNQTYKNFEIIVVCDPSTDNTISIAEQYARCETVRLFKRESPGPGGYASRNLGIKKSRGEWLAFLDADDYWFENHLNNYVELINQMPNSKLFSSRWLSVGGRMSSEVGASLNFHKDASTIVDLHDYLRLYLKDTRILNTNVIMVNKKSLGEKRFPEGKTSKGGDLHLWFSLIKEFKLTLSSHISGVTDRQGPAMVTKTAYFNKFFIIEWYENYRNLISSRSKKLFAKYIIKLLRKESFRYVLCERKRYIRFTDLKSGYPISMNANLFVLAAFHPKFIYFFVYIRRLFKRK